MGNPAAKVVMTRQERRGSDDAGSAPMSIDRLHRTVLPPGLLLVCEFLSGSRSMLPRRLHTACELPYLLAKPH